METFTTTISQEQVLAQLALAEALTEQNGTEYPDNSYEEGVLDALNWLLNNGQGAAAPLDIDLYQDLINKEQE